MFYRVRHTTTYDYESQVLHGRHIAHQRPRATERQLVKSSLFHVTPGPAWSRAGRDYYGNQTDEFELLSTHEQLIVETASLVEVRPAQSDLATPLFRQSWEDIRDRVELDSGCLPQRQFKYDSPLVQRHPLLGAFAERIFTKSKPLHEAVMELNALIFTEFRYEPAATDVSTPLAQVLREKRGVCQDFAHLAVGALRSMGLSARYVSGYLETSPPPGKPRLVGADASHAWASVFFPDYGWVDFDPTNDLLPGERHVTVAWGRDFSDVSPLKGVVLGGGRHVLTVGVDVEPLPSTSPSEPPPVSTALR
ncbi:MAG TPA: transglutaminase family protein [Polyangiaceae bacterium]|nr:transglutaminase family protein [Polyangiaceae bacterium]